MKADAKTMEMIREREITLEVCPSSNIHTGVIKGIEEMKQELYGWHHDDQS